MEEELRKCKDAEKLQVDENRRIYEDHQKEIAKMKKDGMQDSKKQVPMNSSQNELETTDCHRFFSVYILHLIFLNWWYEFFFVLWVCFTIVFQLCSHLFVFS